MLRLIILLLIVGLLFGCNGNPSAVESEIDSDDTAASSDQIASRLVEQLASDERIVDASLNLSWIESRTEARESYLAAASGLESMGISAISSLVDGLKDERYSCSRSYAMVHDYTVADECQRLIDYFVTPDIDPEIDAIPEKRFKWVKGHPMRLGNDEQWHYIRHSHFDLLTKNDRTFARSSIGPWWRQQQGKTLDQIHVDALNRMIQLEDEIGFQSKLQRDKYLEPYLNRLSKLAG